MLLVDSDAIYLLSLVCVATKDSSRPSSATPIPSALCWWHGRSNISDCHVSTGPDSHTSVCSRGGGGEEIQVRIDEM